MHCERSTIMNTNLDNDKKPKATDPKGRKLPKGMTYRRNRYCVKIKDRSGNRREKWFDSYDAANAYILSQSVTYGNIGVIAGLLS